MDNNIDFKVGDYVKVCHSCERFWVLVEGQGDTGWLGKVNNILILAPFALGDAIAFKDEDVLDVYRDATNG